MEVVSYKDLQVWKKGMDLTKRIYEVSAQFPQEELYGLTSQMRKSIFSVPLNIAEGHGRRLTKSFINFLNIAKGSLNEAETCIILARRLGYIHDHVVNELDYAIVDLQKMISGLIKSLEKRLTRSSDEAKTLNPNP